MKFKMAPNSVFAILLRKPWWISFLVAGAFTLVAFALLPEDLRVVGALGALPFFVIGIIAFKRQWDAPSARQVEAITQAVAAMGWAEFSRALVQAYEREGYAVTRVEGGGDLLLERAGGKTLVAARRWKAARHGEDGVQALVDAARAQEAASCVYLALGELSPNARKRVREHGVRWVQGPDLAQLLRGVLPSGG